MEACFHHWIKIIIKVIGSFQNSDSFFFFFFYSEIISNNFDFFMAILIKTKSELRQKLQNARYKENRQTLNCKKAELRKL